MKLEIEIDDRLLPQLVYAAYQAPQGEAEAVTASRGAANIVARYAGMPEIVTEKHAAALAILRDKAMDRAVQCAKPGEDIYTLSRNAEGLLEAVLCQR